MNHKTIELKMSAAMKLAYTLVVLFGILYAIGGTYALLFPEEELSLESALPLLVGVIFFGGGSILVLRLMIRHAGTIEISDEGLAIDTYLTVGRIPWTNFVAVNSFRAMGAKYVGIQIRDIDEYIQSKQSIQNPKRSGDEILTQGFLRFMIAMKIIIPEKLMDVVFSLFGLSGMPKSTQAKDLLLWNYENYGRHLLIQALWFRDIPGLIKTISEGKPPVIESHPEPAAAPAPLPPTPPSGAPSDLKKCPMCAEFVKIDAKVCRFCRYSFEEEKFLT